MTPREQNRLLVLNALQQGRCTLAEAAQVLGLSSRQLRRLRASYQARGATALVHGNRGRPSPRRTSAKTRDSLLRLVRAKYAGINFQHLTELLAEHQRLVLSRPTVHRILKAAGIASPRTRHPPAHRTRRDRMAQEGMLAQFDASHHPWLEDRGPALVLHAGIDDATSKIIGACFETAETAAGYFQVFRQAAAGPGLPLAAYTDRHSIFVGAPRRPLTLEEQLQGQRMPTQLGRAFQELGIQWIPASSPQAKGRIERLFGALQDRLVTELRMAGVRDQAAANAFLPEFVARHNARFAKPAAHPEPVYRPWPADVDPDTIFCFKYVRTVANDHTVRLGPHLVQIVPNGRTYAKARVEVHERLDGTLAVFYQGRRLAITCLTTPPAAPVGARRGQRVNPLRPPALATAPQPRAPSGLHPQRAGRIWKPGTNHPWRRYDQEQRLKAIRKRTKSLST